MMKIGSKIIKVLLTGTAKVAAGAAGVITNPAVRAMIFKQAAKGVLKAGAAISVYEAGAFVYDEALKDGPDGTVTLESGKTPPTTSEADIARVLAQVGLDGEEEVTEANLPKIIAAVRALGNVPKAKIDKLEAQLRREIAEEKEASIGSADAADYVRAAADDRWETQPAGGLPLPPQGRGDTTLLEVAKALNGVAHFSGRPTRAVSDFVRSLRVLFSTPDQVLDTASELMKETGRGDPF